MLDAVYKKLNLNSDWYIKALNFDQKNSTLELLFFIAFVAICDSVKAAVNI